MPKSMSLIWSSLSTMMFSGFKSRWTTPWVWMYSSALQMPAVIRIARSAGSLRRSLMISRSRRPSTHSITM